MYGMIVQSVVEDIKVAESTNQKVFRCDNNVNLEVVSLLNVPSFLPFLLLNSHTKVQEHAMLTF